MMNLTVPLPLAAVNIIPTIKRRCQKEFVPDHVGDRTGPSRPGAHLGAVTDGTQSEGTEVIAVKNARLSWISIMISSRILRTMVSDGVRRPSAAPWVSL